MVAVLFKRQGGEWRHTGWPLCALCHQKECSSVYAIGFGAVLAELESWGLPKPVQLHVDWFAGQGPELSTRAPFPPFPKF